MEQYIYLVVPNTQKTLLPLNIIDIYRLKICQIYSWISSQRLLDAIHSRMCRFSLITAEMCAIARNNNGKTNQRNYTLGKIDDEECVAASWQQCIHLVDMYRSCRGDLCDGHYWKLGSWSPCNAACGGGVAKREVACVRFLDGSLVDPDSCGFPPSNTERDCNTSPCKSYLWKVFLETLKR